MSTALGSAITFVVGSAIIIGLPLIAWGGNDIPTAGIALIFRSWLGLILDAAIALVLLWRIRDEEGIMRQEFGTKWEAYADRTWSLIPFLY